MADKKLPRHFLEVSWCNIAISSRYVQYCKIHSHHSIRLLQLWAKESQYWHISNNTTSIANGWQETTKTLPGNVLVRQSNQLKYRQFCKIHNLHNTGLLRLWAKASQYVHIINNSTSIVDCWQETTKTLPGNVLVRQSDQLGHCQCCKIHNLHSTSFPRMWAKTSQYVHISDNCTSTAYH